MEHMEQKIMGIDAERFHKLREAVKKYQGEGLDRRDRREAVISQVAASSLDEEPAEVQERAINKYWKVEEGGEVLLPVLVVAPHAQRPGQGELINRLREKFPDDDRAVLVQAVNNWLEAPVGKKPHKTASEDDPLKKYYNAIRLMRIKADPATDEVARLAAGGQDNGVTVMVAKKSRMWADPNRRSWFHRPRGAGKGTEFVPTAEYPTSVRAAWFWQLRRTLSRTVGLSKAGQLEQPFLQLVVHRMANRINEATGDRYDVVIGGGGTKKGEAGYLADPEVIKWFAREITKRLADEGVRVGAQEERVQVAIDSAKDGNVKVFSMREEVESQERERIGVGLSGRGLGLEYFRTGHVFEKTTVEKGKEGLAESLPNLRFPGFGSYLQTLQVELSGALLEDEAKRRAVGSVLHYLVLEFPQRFKTAEDLKESLT